MSERIERVITSGTFSLDGGCWDVDNNVWIVGNDSSVIIIDPAHDVDKISRTVAGRTVEKILLTHAHDDHIRSAKEAAERFGAPVYLNPADRVLWEMVYPSWDFDRELADGDVLRIGDTELTVLATPATPRLRVLLRAHPQLGEQRRRRLLRRHPSSTAAPAQPDAPTATSTPSSESISTRLLTLPESTAVLTGHGDSTGIGLEAPERPRGLSAATSVCPRGTAALAATRTARRYAARHNSGRPRHLHAGGGAFRRIGKREGLGVQGASFSSCSSRHR